MNDAAHTRRTGFYAGSFDPPTNGHVEIIRRAAALVDRLVVAIGVHPGKAATFPADDRVAMIREACAGLSVATTFDVVTFDGLAVDAARAAGASILVRGLRDGTDLDYEMQLAGMNGTLAPGLQTVFLPSSPGVRPITATLVRQIAAMGGDVAPFVPASILPRINARFSKP